MDKQRKGKAEVYHYNCMWYRPPDCKGLASCTYSVERIRDVLPEAFKEETVFHSPAIISTPTEPTDCPCHEPRNGRRTK